MGLRKKKKSRRLKLTIHLLPALFLIGLASQCKTSTCSKRSVAWSKVFALFFFLHKALNSPSITSIWSITKHSNLSVINQLSRSTLLLWDVAKCTNCGTATDLLQLLILGQGLYNQLRPPIFDNTHAAEAALKAKISCIAIHRRDADT